MGTTFGYDLFFPDQVSVVAENRIYDSSFDIIGIPSKLNDHSIRVLPSL